MEDVRYLSTSDGARLALTEIRRGEPRDGPRFLLVHGFAQNRLAFTLGPLPELLIERGARVFVGELRGHGRSRDGVTPHHSLEAHLSIDLPALIEEIGPPVHLIGHSMGGMLGYALLARSNALASLTAIGAPIFLGRGRTLIRLAALIAGPVGGVSPVALPIDRFLRLLSGMIAEPDARGVTRWFQLLTKLASPQHAPPRSIEAILANADPASPAIFTEIARLAFAREPTIAGVRLIDALLAATIPVATVVGSEDVFGGRVAVAPFDLPENAGPRRVIEVAGGSHVDLTIGHHLPATVAQLWPFVTEGR